MERRWGTGCALPISTSPPSPTRTGSATAPARHCSRLFFKTTTWAAAGASRSRSSPPAAPPGDRGHEQLGLDPPLVARDQADRAIDERLLELVRYEPQVEQVLVLGVVVVRLHLGARVGQVIDLGLEAVVRACGLHAL